MLRHAFHVESDFVIARYGVGGLTSIALVRAPAASSSRRLLPLRVPTTKLGIALKTDPSIDAAGECESRRPGVSVCLVALWHQ